ncbi:MAG: hypothetical protein QME68_08770 [Elusimicrobiota bacterium]|nr:hypothetical protein [Elusimicrobiota bacterium]
MEGADGGVWSNGIQKFDLSFIISRLEEMVLGQAGANVFEDIFKLIYAKGYYRPRFGGTLWSRN